MSRPDRPMDSQQVPGVGLLLLPIFLAFPGEARAERELVSTRPSRAGWVERELGKKVADPTTLPEALKGKPVSLVGEGALVACSGEALSPKRLENRLSEVDWNLEHGALPEASIGLRQATRDLACLSAPASPELLARIHILRGRVAAGRGLPALARDEMRRALAIEPGIEPAPEWGMLSQKALTEARKAPAPASIRLKVPGAAGRLWLDGQEGDADELLVSPGPHLLQNATGTGYLIQASKGDQLVLPPLIEDDALKLVRDGKQGQAELSALFSVAYPKDAEVLVQDKGSVWSTVVGTGKFTPLPLHRPGERLIIGGLGLLVLGGAGATTAWLWNESLVDGCEAESTRVEGPRDCKDYGTHQMLDKVWGASLATAGLGGLSAGAGGITMTIRSRPVKGKKK